MPVQPSSSQQLRSSARRTDDCSLRSDERSSKSGIRYFPSRRGQAGASPRNPVSRNSTERADGVNSFVRHRTTKESGFELMSLAYRVFPPTTNVTPPHRVELFSDPILCFQRRSCRHLNSCRWFQPERWRQQILRCSEENPRPVFDSRSDRGFAALVVLE